MKSRIIMFLRQPRTLTGIGIGVACIILYTITLAPDVLAHDSSEWQAAGVTWGVSHAPGSPAYTIVSNIISLVPIGNPAARVSFVSALVATAGVVSLYALMLLLFERMLPALVASATLAVSGVWWSQASVADPYCAIPAIIAVLFSLLILWNRQGDIRLAWAGAALAGFGIAWHPSMLYFMPVLLAGLFVMGPWRKLIKPKPLAITIVLALAGLSLYAYLPIRSAADPPILSSKINSLTSFYRFITAADVRTISDGVGVVSAPSLGQLGDRLSEVVRQSYYPSYAFLVFGPAIILLYPAVWPTLRPLRRKLIFIMAGMVGHLLVVFSVSGIYSQYYLSLLLYFAIWAGFSVYLLMAMGEAYLGKGAQRHIPVVIAGVVYFGVLIWGIQYTWPFVNHSDDTGMRDLITEVVAQAHEGAIVIANWDSSTGLLYLQKVEGKRNDIQLVGVTKGKDDWREALAAARENRPTAQVLLAFTLPIIKDPDMIPVSREFPLSIKGRTYHDFRHGDPLPAPVQLFELTS